jgi:hypothetical protein
MKDTVWSVSLTDNLAASGVKYWAAGRPKHSWFVRGTQLTHCAGVGTAVRFPKFIEYADSISVSTSILIA